MENKISKQNKQYTDTLVVTVSNCNSFLNHFDQEVNNSDHLLLFIIFWMSAQTYIVSFGTNLETYSSSETRTAMKSPKRVMTKASVESKELVDSDGSCFSPRSLFALPSDGGSFTLESLHFDEDSSDQDLLLDVRSNSSFPQAELLHPPLSFGAQQASNSSSSVNLRLMHHWQFRITTTVS